MAVPTLVDLTLAPPDPGSRELRHDATFTAWDSTFSELRDVVNLGIDALNKAGAGLPRLPEESLEELVVLPLTGDYAAIRQNANACGDVRSALHVWADNLLRLSVGVDPAWGGRAATAYVVRVNAFGLAGRAVAELVGAGAGVLEVVADFAERLAVEVERLLVDLGQALFRLVAKLSAKVSGPLGWAAFAAELVTRGLDAVTDIVDDVRLVVDLVRTLLDLRDTVAAWVGEQRERLALFAGLPGLMSP
ncbi:WXG100 family type VII secretion target [Nocardioides sp. zg-DK7169]|uniref:WXG100 family type VII secretion target n=1 Tax=Nocardioides sp. zg-DK7169 TaxID=2736600 RepID=UPI001555281A|nr:hypothetical protein [Nocardioides sp. zg-DK7169]NPC98837.1 hypothetical protein [Nocardioides sp. zg-DK7169]